MRACLALLLALVLSGCSTSRLPQLDQATENTVVKATKRWRPPGRVDMSRVIDKERLTLLFFYADW